MKDLIELTFNNSLEKLPSKKEINKMLFQKESKILYSTYMLPTTHKFNRPLMEQINIRSKYIKYSFPILSEEFILSIKDAVNKLGVKKIIELSSGPGWLTFWLRKYGVNVYSCVDNYSWKSFLENDNYLPFVEKEDSRKIVRQEMDVDMFILSWPYMNSVAAEIWKGMKKDQYLLYIGESDGGCTADEEFFKLTEDKYVKNIYFQLMNFEGVHDNCILYRK